jgi:ATP/maltotriose-dependent transcriptional regulator MalT
MKNGFKAIFGLQADRVQNHLLEIATRQPTLYMEQLAAMLRERMSKREDPSGGHGIPLTKRELDILRRLATGLPLVQIAGTLHISQNTIKTHLKNLYRKMDVESRQEAVTRGRELSLL